MYFFNLQTFYLMNQFDNISFCYSTNFNFDYFQFRNTLYGDARDWARRLFAFLIPLVPRVMNPHNRLVQQWNKFFAICCLVAIFVDPLFFFLLSVQKVWFSPLTPFPTFMLIQNIVSCIQLVPKLKTPQNLVFSSYFIPY